MPRISALQPNVLSISAPRLPLENRSFVLRDRPARAFGQKLARHLLSGLSWFRSIAGAVLSGASNSSKLRDRLQSQSASLLSQLGSRPF
jgi:hypothetical protein